MCLFSKSTITRCTKRYLTEIILNTWKNEKKKKKKKRIYQNTVVNSLLIILFYYFLIKAEDFLVTDLPDIKSNSTEYAG